MASLYFVDSKKKEHLVCKNVSREKVHELVSLDQSKRDPSRVIYYTRAWEDDNGNYWIDYGSHTEFYVIKEDE